MRSRGVGSMETQRSRSDDLIREARRIVELTGVRQSTVLIDRLADALEAAEASRDAALAVIEKAREAVKWGSRMDRTPTRMHVGQADIWWQSWHLQADEAWRKNMTEALSSVPADVLRERDRRVRAEGAAEALESAADHINRDFQHLPSWDAAWEAGERTRDWEIGCTRTLIDTVDWLRARAASVRADAIERNSEGSET